MARKPRLHVPGGFYHVMLRGNGGQDIFFAKADRRYLYELLAEGSERFGYRVHGFCLMRNHIHLVVQPGEVALSRPMQNLAFRHARRINARRQRIGHLFQGRYKAILVDADSYLLALVRYVHLNPVRAGLVARAEDYPWSGHRAYLGRDALAWLTTEVVLGQFGKRLATARAGYQAFVRDGLDHGRRDEFLLGGKTDSRVLADDRFVERVTKAPPTPAAPPGLDDLVAAVCAAQGVAAGDLARPSRARELSRARAITAWLARESGAVPLSRVAARFGRDPSALSHGLHRLDRRTAKDAAFAERLRRLYNSIIQA